MANLKSIVRSKNLCIFLNIAFLFLIIFYLTTIYYLYRSHEPSIATDSSFLYQMHPEKCDKIHDFIDNNARCLYVKSHIGCSPKGYISYLQLFYCTCGKLPFFGYLLLLLWLLVLFYLLGDTAANYFCSSLENLSKVLKLSPSIAGVTLLSLGNGASDVFSSIVSFTRSGNGDVGLNSILGGAFFISSVVVGVICLCTSSNQISVDKPSFLRDVLFFLFTLCSLFFMFLVGHVTVWGAIFFVLIYLFFVLTVTVTHFLNSKQERNIMHLSTPSPSLSKSFGQNSNEFTEVGIPLLGYVDDEKPIVLIHEDQEKKSEFFDFDLSKFSHLDIILKVLHLPLYLPRRLTIPVVCKDKWSKPFAVISVTLAPLLLAALFSSQRGQTLGSNINIVTFLIAGSIGLVFGNLAYATCNKTSPPNNNLLPWLAGGFIMSVSWTYLCAEELVSLLISIGQIMGIDPSILGLTVLAWGNSMGDLIANVAMAVNGGPDGAQIAISGCYAGPMFNTLVGLGMSLVFSSWSEYPDPYVIPDDHSLYETLGFLMGGLLWALVILPRNNMKLDRFLGIGLLSIYVCFLFLRAARIFGILNLT
ncbi:hypothetical protein ACFE04_026885 [Oxalis oulophora]